MICRSFDLVKRRPQVELCCLHGQHFQNLQVVFDQRFVDMIDSDGLQGDSDGAVLTKYGESQALRCRDALSQIPFDR